MSARTLFVTGTDTGVGKTTISCALAAAFRQAGRRVAVLKPIETGCMETAGDLVPRDARRLAQAAGVALPDELLCPNRYPLPVSPEAASLAAVRPVDFAAIHQAHRSLAADADLLLAEGAGGLLVPLAPGVLIADLVRQLSFPLLIVARASLGTVNHTLLTLEAARSRRLSVIGVVLNRVLPAGGPDEASNAAAIAQHGRIPVWGTFPHAPDADVSVLAELAQRHLDLQGLWQAL